MIFSALLHTYVCTYVLNCKDRAQSPLTKSPKITGFIIGHENFPMQGISGHDRRFALVKNLSLLMTIVQGGTLCGFVCKEEG